MIDLKTSDYDTLLAAYTGRRGERPDQVASNDDFGNSSQSRIRFQATSGTIYRIRVDGFNGDTGTINLDLHQNQPPVNDNFPGTVLSGVSTSRLGDTNEGATLQVGEAGTVAGARGRVRLVLVDGTGERADDDRHGDERLQHTARGLHRRLGQRAHRD